MSLITPVGLDDSRHRIVRRTVVGALVITMSTTAVMLVALVLFSDQDAIVLKAYFGTLALLLSLRLINLVPAAYADGHAAEAGRGRRRGKPLPNWPADLFEMQDRISLATVSEFDYHVRLRSYLQDLAAKRLAARWNIDLYQQPDQAKRRLGDDLWNEIGAPSDAVGRRDVRGPSLARLRALIEGLERI